jgi:hypothetical protein
MALKHGNGLIAIKRGRVVKIGESAFEIKARLLVKKQQQAKQPKPPQAK